MSSKVGLLLDNFMPCFDTGRCDSTWLPASPEDAYAALKSVTAGEVRWFAPLLLLRHLPRRILGQADPLDLSAPILEGFLRAGFIVLGERLGREYVIGGIGRFWSPSQNRPINTLQTPEDFVVFSEPGFIKAAFNFTVAPEVHGTRLTSEIRMSGTSPEATAWFRVYWFTIGWLSGLIRYSGFHAIRRVIERKDAA